MDKDRAGMLKTLAPLARRVILTQASNPRATRPAELAADLPPIEAVLAPVPEPAAALEQALSAGDVEVVCVTGSLFLVADALRWLGARGLLPPLPVT
jgi:folylpolyglutamate synthase/dihydropteroate synthase